MPNDPACPACGSEHSHTTDTRAGSLESLPARRRRRECKQCAHRWTTYEISGEAYRRLESDILQRLVTELVEAVKRRAKQ